MNQHPDQDAHDAMDDTAGLEMPACPQCEGEPIALGTLGRFVQYRCRSCGWVFHERA